MKQLSKLLMFVLAMALLVSTLAGCGGGAKKPGELQVIDAWASAVHSESAVQEYVAKVNETVLKQKGIELKYQTFGNDYGKTLDMAIANDQAPELFSGPIGQYANKKQIRAIDDLPGGKELMAMYPESVEASDPLIITGEKKAKTYSLIVTFTTGGMVYNKDLFKKAGIVDANGNAKPPETWAEMREYAKKLTNPTNQEYGIMMPFKWSAYSSSEFITPFQSSLRYGVYDVKTGTYDYSMYKPLLEWWMGIKEDKSFYPGPEGIDNDPARAKFSEGKVGMKFAASYDVAVFNDLFPAQCDWGVAPYPVVDKNTPRYMQAVSTNSFVSASNMAKDDQYPAIVECMKLLYSVDLQQLTYEKGMNIPVAKAAMDNAKNVTTKKGWKEFGDMLKISRKGKKTYESPVIKLEGDTDQATYMKVWSGVMTVDQALADLTKRYNQAFERGVASGDIDKSLSVVPDYAIEKFTQPPMPESLQVK